MSESGKTDNPEGNDEREEIRWFESYEKHSRTKHLERLRNEDLLNYIKDVEENCRLEVSSGDEDYAGTRKSSECSLRCSGTRFGSLRGIKSRVTSRKSKNLALQRERKRRESSGRDASACNYCCSARKSHLRGNSDLTVGESFRRGLNASTKSIYQRPSLSRNSRKHRESLPTLYGWYSRKNRKMWPTATETASFEVTEDWPQSAVCDFRIGRSRTSGRKSAKVHAFESPRRDEVGGPRYTNICPSTSPSEKTTGRKPRYRGRKPRGEGTRMGKSNEESSASSFENQQPLNKMYPARDAAYSRAALQDGGYKGRCAWGYRYPVRKPRPPTSWELGSRSNGWTTSTRLPGTSSLSHGRASRWENQVGPPLRAFSSITGASINRSYQRETSRKNNTDRRWPDILGDRESLYYRRPELSRESGKLREVVPTYEDKQWRGRCRGDARCCPENANELVGPRRESTRRSAPMGKRVDYAAATLSRTLPKPVESRGNDKGEFEADLSEEDSQNEDNDAFDVFDDVRTSNHDGATDSRDLQRFMPRMSFLDDRARRGSSEVARDYGKSSNDLKSGRREAVGARTALRERITARGYPAGKGFSFAIRTPEKPVSGDFSGLGYDATESTCECKEPFHDPPAACSVGSCSCIGNSEDAGRNNGDSSRWTSNTARCCRYCSRSSSTSRDEKDPVKKLESFCERVKAVNQDMFQKPARSTCRSATGTNTRVCAHGGQNQSEFGAQRTVGRARSIEGEWLTDPARPRLEEPRRGRSGASPEKILIYPPRGEGGPPLMLYKRSSNISCRVKGDADTGFRYSVTYVQKFTSPAWTPGWSPQVVPRETGKECGCSVDYG